MLVLVKKKLSKKLIKLDPKIESQYKIKPYLQSKLFLQSKLKAYTFSLQFP